MTGWALSRTAAYADSAPDELLIQMIDEMLFSANADVRDGQRGRLDHRAPAGPQRRAVLARALGRRGPWLRGLVYALGMAGQHARLARICRDADMPAEARVAARWWSNLPASLIRDARR